MSALGSRPTRGRSAVTPAALAALALLAAAAVGWWLGLGVPRPVAEPATDRLQCLSYAPFRDPATSPLVLGTRVSEAQIETDLRLLSARTGCVRTYSVQQGLDAVPAVARRLGMSVMLGVWIGRNRVENELELARAVTLAREYPDVLRAIIVGNEVLLRRELPESELIRYIDRVRQATPVPVTYADVWEFWNKHPAVAPAVSFVTIHILPYWEDEPVGIDGSIAHVVDIHRLMQARFPDKALLIGETGWPSAGRARREAVPGRVAQARFVREFTHAAQQHALRYNLIEAFDQPWKRQLEGAMGGAWGLLDRHGELKFPWRGPVAEVPDWHAGPIAAAAGAALFGAIAAFGAGAGPRGGANPRARGRGRHLLAAALAGAALGAVLALQWRYLVTWNRYLLEWTVSTGYTLLALAYAGLALRCLDRRNRVVPAAAETLARIRRRAAVTPLHGLSLLNAAFLFGAATMIVLHVFDGRYRGFPTPLYIVPLAASALLWIAGAARFRGGIEERWLAATIAAGGLLVIALERPSNLQAVGFVAVVIALAAIGSGLLYRRGAGAAARASTSTPSKPPTAAGS